MPGQRNRHGASSEGQASGRHRAHLRTVSHRKLTSTFIGAGIIVPPRDLDGRASKPNRFPDPEVRRVSSSGVGVASSGFASVSVGALDPGGVVPRWPARASTLADPLRSDGIIGSLGAAGSQWALLRLGGPGRYFDSGVELEQMIGIGWPKRSIELYEGEPDANGEPREEGDAAACSSAVRACRPE